ncbi:MAG: TlyA family RNA methyltransferase [Hyphomicrobiaceae bacterium]
MRQRLDNALVALGLVQSRARAADLIARGAVRIDGIVAGKAGQLVSSSAVLDVDRAANAYVARSGAKLEAALTAFGFEPAGRVALDVGASTGGFTQVLLQGGASCIYAVDVGHGQLAPVLRDDPRVVNLERCDARGLTEAQVPRPVSAVVADVSFISLTAVLGAALRLAAPDAWLVALVKPQFELGRGVVGKGGIVRAPEARERAVTAVSAWLTTQGWRVVGDLPSPLPGKDGNVEHLIGSVRNAG